MVMPRYDTTLDGMIESPLIVESDIRSWFWDIALAVCHLHRIDVVHFDISVQNILVRQERQAIFAYLGDFGLAREGVIGTFPRGGTPMYEAPEMIAGKCTDGRPADMWSFGVALHYALTGNMPFATDADVLAWNGAPGTLFRESRREISPGARDLVRRLLSPRPEDRPTAEELAVEAGWFVGVKAHERDKLRGTELFGPDDIPDNVETTQGT
jgi:serine/threonine protein kinase